MSESHETFTHLDEAGRLRMVDVSDKPVTRREAVASARVVVGPDVLRALQDKALPKGDAISVARVAGILAAKRTDELIPLCHGLAPEHIDVQISPEPPDALRIVATARVQARTGVEMEAMVAASVAALTIYDMCKALRRDIEIGPVRLERKSGGRSGTWTRQPEE